MTYVEIHGVLLGEPCDPAYPGKVHESCDPDWYSRCECDCHPDTEE